MRILMINGVCGIRSTGRICTNLAAVLEEHGHEVKIAYGREKVPEQYQKYAVRIGSDLDVKFHAIKARLFDAAGFGSRRATVKFIDWVKEYDPDVIHLHNIHGYYIHIGVLFDYLKTCGKKVIWTLHDCWAITGHTAYCDVAHCTRWKDGCGKCPLKHEYPKSIIDQSEYNWKKKQFVFEGVPALEIITPSEWLANWVRESFMKTYPVKVIHNGIDITTFHPTESDFRIRHGVEDNILLLGVATSWDANKGLSDFIELSKRLDENYRVVLVGLTDNQVKSLPDNIIKITRTNNVRELAAIYSASDCFLNLSYCENYPTVNLEAQSCGTPVITYQTGGSAESVDLDYGAVIMQGNITQVCETINRMTFKRIPENSKFDEKKIYSQYISLYSGRQP